ncbi:MAG TPA: CotH kinase family protein [Saprospiraceae bacterium]|nr:CotH kinase family protein [Saprospiraceae bacterium]
MTASRNIISTFRYYILFTVSFFIFFGIRAQNPFPEYAPIYKDDVVGRIDIKISISDLTSLLAPGNEEMNEYYNVSFIFDNGSIRDTFNSVGLKLRGNTSRFSKKKSFQLSLNTYVPGRTWHGIEKLDLNGEHNDPTVSRSKICWDLLRDIGIPAPRANHIQLFINGEYFGLYANDEHIDEEFVRTRFGSNDGNLYKCLYPADLTYLGSNPDAYKFMSGGRRAYELNTHEAIDDYSDLAHFIDVLNNTSADEMQCALEKVFNVNAYLKAMVFDILAGNWDGPLYNKNNFFLYHNPVTGLFEYIPFDLDNTFGIDWFHVDWSDRSIYSWCHESQPRPLYWNILQVEEYRNRFSYYINKISHEYYKEAVLFPRLDSLKILLAPFIQDDAYYTMDYGFTIEDFNKGFSQSLPFSHTPIGIKPFISTRRSSALQQMELEDISPIISDVKNNLLHPAEIFTMQAQIEDDQPIESVQLFYQINGAGPTLLLAFVDDGLHQDEKADDGIYGVSFSLPGVCNIISYSIVAKGLNSKESHYPVCDVKTIEVCNSALTLVINELMASNETTVTDENGEYEDWVEIFNFGMDAIYLGDKYLSDKADDPVKWKFPDISIQPGEYLVVWADEDGSQGELHANFKLSAAGEYVALYDNDVAGNALIDGIAFGAQLPDIAFGRLPNGTGSFQVLAPTPGSKNEMTLTTSEVNTSLTFQIFPNPARDIFYVESHHTNSSPYRMVILNMFGQVILEQDGQTGNSFDMSQFANGIYMVGITGNLGFRIIGKMIKN